jgi:iron complex transport system substrate-binding protein
VRICSFLPSATEIIAGLGLVDSLVGVSEECRWPTEVIGKPIVTATKIDSVSMSSVAIDEAVRASARDGRSLYSVDADLLGALQPDLIVTQDLCAVCAVSSGELESACPVGAEVLSLDPRTLGEVMATVRTLAFRLGVESVGEAIVESMRTTLEGVATPVRELPRRRVFFAEWIEPPFCAGHWLPEMIALAGGTDVLGRAGEPSHVTSWEVVRSLRPELVILGPCGFDIDEAASRSGDLDLPCAAVIVDGDSFYSRPAPRLADGVRQLAFLLHPEVVPDPGLPFLELQPTRAEDGRRQGGASTLA